MIYKNYWLDTLSVNTILTNDEYFTSQVEDMSAKIKSFNLSKSGQLVKNQDNNKNYQRKLDDIAKLNTQTNLNLQNELLKTIIFNDK